MKKAILRCIRIGFFGLLVSAGTAFAQTEAYTNSPANLRAGPAPDYPLVAQIPEGVLVSVIGCLSDYSWCCSAIRTTAAKSRCSIMARRSAFRW